MPNSIGFSYKITRSRESVAFRRMIDNGSNLQRVLNPAALTQFYDFTAEIAAPREHLLKLYAQDNVFHSSHVISSVLAHEVVVTTDIQMVAPHYGTNDYYEIYRRENNGSLTLLHTSQVSDYKALDNNTYHLIFLLQTASGIPEEVFLARIENKITMDPILGPQAAQQPAVFERVATPEELSLVPTTGTFVFNTSKAGFQRFRSKQFDAKYPTQEDADAAEAGLLGQLMVLVRKLLAPNRLKPAFAVVPGSGTVQIGQQIQLDAIGETGVVSWHFTMNESGGTLTAQGLYTAGATAGSDTIQATDLNGNVITLTFSVQNTYASVFSGEFEWQQV